jgi:hypothetical protein
MNKRHALAATVVSLVALSGCVTPPDADTREPDERPAAAEPAAAADAAVRVEQAERALDVGRDLPGARAALEALLADKDAPVEVRDRAAMVLSRACEQRGSAADPRRSCPHTAVGVPATETGLPKVAAHPLPRIREPISRKPASRPSYRHAPSIRMAHRP